MGTFYVQILSASAPRDGAWCRTWTPPAWRPLGRDSPLGSHVLLCSKLLASASSIGARRRTWVRGHTLLYGGGGGLADSCRAAPYRSRTLRFLGRFGVDPLFRCAYRSSVKALTVQGQPPFYRGRAPLGTPRPGGHARGTRAAGWGGGHAKGPQDATAGILALLSRVWYPARRAIALSVVFLKESCPKAAYGTRAWGVK